MRYKTTIQRRLMDGAEAVQFWPLAEAARGVLTERQTIRPPKVLSLDGI